MQHVNLRRPLLALAVVGVVLVGGCARHYSGAGTHGEPYGFLSGVWHGLIFPYALLTNIVSWALGLAGIDFLSSVQIVGRPNTGVFFYYLGFLLGLSAYSGAHGATSRAASNEH